MAKDYVNANRERKKGNAPADAITSLKLVSYWKWDGGLRVRPTAPETQQAYYCSNPTVSIAATCPLWRRMRPPNRIEKSQRFS